MRAIRTAQRAVAAAVDAGDLESAAAEVSEALVGILGLRACWFEAGATAPDLPELRPDGDVDLLVQRHVRGGLGLPPLLTVPVRVGGEVVGRFVLESDPDVGISVERRVLASALADVVAVRAARRR
mgnify:CR=1 FL=1